MSKKLVDEEEKKMVPVKNKETNWINKLSSKETEYYQCTMKAKEKILNNYLLENNGNIPKIKIKTNKL